MATITTVTTCDPDAAAAFRVPRDCVLILERPDGDGRFAAEEGPFDLVIVDLMMEEITIRSIQWMNL